MSIVKLGKEKGKGFIEYTDKSGQRVTRPAKEQGRSWAEYAADKAGGSWNSGWAFQNPLWVIMEQKTTRISAITALSRWQNSMACPLTITGADRNKKHPNADLAELHLSDATIELLKSEKINTRLLCEMAAHKDFVKLLANMGIYVDGIASIQVQNLNA